MLHLNTGLHSEFIMSVVFYQISRCWCNDYWIELKQILRKNYQHFYILLFVTTHLLFEW